MCLVRDQPSDRTGPDRVTGSPSLPVRSARFLAWSHTRIRPSRTCGHLPPLIHVRLRCILMILVNCSMPIRNRQSHYAGKRSRYINPPCHTSSLIVILEPRVLRLTIFWFFHEEERDFIFKNTSWFFFFFFFSFFLVKVICCGRGSTFNKVVVRSRCAKFFPWIPRNPRISKRGRGHTRGSLLRSSTSSSFRKRYRGPPTLEIRYADPGDDPDH